MRVLIACEFSGRVREAFKAKGHDAWSCDLLPTEIPGQHIQDDVLKHLNDGWDMMIAHPPCTYLCNSGVRWLKNNNERFGHMIQSSAFFNILLQQNIPRIAIENPIQHFYARQQIRQYDQIIQPYYFGEPESKATCLWLKGLPKLHPTKQVMPIFQSVHREPPGIDRWKNRSRTFQGIAEAMANQWNF